MKLSNRDTALICSITPYFLEKGNSWLEENLKKILKARKTNLFFSQNTIYLEKNQQYKLLRLLRRLDELGYEKVFEVTEPGEFSHRGGIVDVFPINLNFALRIEFFGNKIEQILRLPIEIGDEKQSKELLKKKLKSQKLFSNLKGLRPGDYLVHLDHGIAKFLGYFTFPLQSDKVHDRIFCQTKKYYLLEYAKGDRLYVPLGLERKLSRYLGFSEPKISRLGSLAWQKSKRKAKKEAEKLAKELLAVYLKRETSARPPYQLDPEIEKKLVNSFPFEETPDQLQALKEIKQDLQKKKPMDRIVCGDVGFGKTEIALRTMAIVAGSGFQSAMLSPTTILANQHFQNFKKRLKGLPFKVALLSRFQSQREQQKIIKELALGKIDIVVGTHRLLSKDVSFKRLGLLVIDDEQRFGVRQKEFFKKIRSLLDVLSLSATPIPRTLYMALSSLRTISLIQTPPLNRLPIKTFILPFSKKTIKKAISQELKRGGQIYFLYNRVETIERAKKLLEKISRSLKPKPKIGLVHAKLKEKELLKTMEDFQAKKIDLLVATTIIENGIDLPNVNTLIVAESNRLGLSQAYQIRGRIGRSHIPAFAYFLHREHLSEKARERLKALKEAQELGSGYRIALKDLEMRGAGNILGKEQSGTVNRVGLNLFCQMLSMAVEKMKSG